MEETYIKLNSTQKIVFKNCFHNWLQSVPTGTGYIALYTCFNNWFQSVPTDTGYTALYTCFNNWLQSVPTGTGFTALYTCFNNWFQSVPTGTSYTALYTCFSNWLHMTSTYRLQSLLTGYWLHSPYCTVLHPNLVQFFAGYRELLFTVNYRLWRPVYRTVA